jgi:hypothetical protein
MKEFLMFCLDAVVMCTCVSYTDLFLWGSSWSCIDIVCVCWLVGI